MGGGEQRGLSERRGDLPTVAPEPQASELWAQGRQRIMGQPSVGVAGSGWSRGSTRGTWKQQYEGRNRGRMREYAVSRFNRIVPREKRSTGPVHKYATLGIHFII